MNRPDQLRSHLGLASRNGLTREELAEAITHLAFYSGWPGSVTAAVIAKDSASAEVIQDPTNSSGAIAMKSKLIHSVLFAATIGALSGVSMAADYKQNPFTLAYEGAMTENVNGQVNIRPVSYKLNGLDISANVYTPANYDASKKYPTVVVAHPNGGVKEQVAGLYAQRLAEQGYITIAADAAYQGASGGQPRNVDKPAFRIEDIHGMADFISQFAGVDTARLGLLGICGGGGYSLAAAQTDKRFKSIATVSMFNSGRVRRNGYVDSALNTIQTRLQQASAARAQEAAGGTILYSGDANLTDEQIAKLPFDLYRQGYEYYWKTHAHPNSTFKYTTSSLLDLMRFDATSQIELIDKPLLMISRQQGRQPVHDRGRHGQGHRHEGQGAVPDRRCNTHRNLLETALRESGGGEADPVLRQVALRQILGRLHEAPHFVKSMKRRGWK